MPRARFTSTGVSTGYRFRASGPVDGTGDTELGDEAKDNEAKGHLGASKGGSDTYEFSGVPTAFDADKPWEIEIGLDMGSGEFVEYMPTFLNAIILEITSDGAHYQVTTSGTGMILRHDKANDNDGVLDGDNQLVGGRVAKGGVDSWRIWPAAGFDVVADGPAQMRLASPETDWVDVPVFVPEMRF